MAIKVNASFVAIEPENVEIVALFVLTPFELAVMFPELVKAETRTDGGALKGVLKVTVKVPVLVRAAVYPVPYNIPPALLTVPLIIRNPVSVVLGIVPVPAELVAVVAVVAVDADIVSADVRIFAITVSSVEMLASETL